MNPERLGGRNARLQASHAGLAELWFGPERRLRNFICVGIRSGIAAGMVVGGHLLRGSDHRAGEIGQWTCPVPAALAMDAGLQRGDSWSDQVGARLEQIASLSVIVAAARRGLDRKEPTSLAGVDGEITIEDILVAAERGDSFAMLLVQAVARVHGWVAYQLDRLFAPERIIFAGPLADLGELFLSTGRETVSELAGDGHVTTIANSTLGQYNGALGAAALALHQWKPKR